MTLNGGEMNNVILFNKPFGTLCQFSAHEKHPTLAEFIDAPNFYPAGRLDRDSEGLLLLTNDGKLQHRISHPKHKLAKHYWVQVEGEVDQKAINLLTNGVALNDGPTLRAKVKAIRAPIVWDREPPIRKRQNIPTSWLEIIIREGRNRQVRRMTAAVGFPTLRLIRFQIGSWTLDELAPGEYGYTSISLPTL